MVSTAARTRETWALADPGGAAATYDRRVYDATTEELREVVAETDASDEVLAVVGHNPGVERLAWELDDSPVAREQLDRGLRTCAVAVFRVADWSLGDAVLEQLVVARSS